LTTSKALLTSVVVEGDTSGCKSISKGALKEFLVWLSIKESGVVMIVNKDTESINILEGALLFSPSLADCFHWFLVHEDVSDCVVHWVVKKTVDVVLVVTNIWVNTIEAFSHLEDSSRLAVLSPEILRYFWDCIDSDTIESVVLDEILDPGLKVASYKWVFLFEIWEISKSAVLDLVLIIPVIDLTLWMVVGSLVEGIDSWEIISNWSNVVSNNVNHYPDSHWVSCVNHVLKSSIASKVLVSFLPVCSPVSMESTSSIVNNWRDPDCVEAEVLDVLEILGNTVVVTTAVVWLFSEVTASLAAISLCESVSNNLINWSLFPLSLWAS
jgi:uncharacterized membrane protein